MFKVQVKLGNMNNMSPFAGAFDPAKGLFLHVPYSINTSTVSIP